VGGKEKEEWLRVKKKRGRFKGGIKGGGLMLGKRWRVISRKKGGG
jgi:hypothetical protein